MKSKKKKNDNMVTIIHPKTGEEVVLTKDGRFPTDIKDDFYVRNIFLNHFYDGSFIEHPEKLPIIDLFWDCFKYIGTESNNERYEAVYRGRVIEHKSYAEVGKDIGRCAEQIRKNEYKMYRLAKYRYDYFGKKILTNLMENNVEFFRK